MLIQSGMIYVERRDNMRISVKRLIEQVEAIKILRGKELSISISQGISVSIWEKGNYNTLQMFKNNKEAHEYLFQTYRVL